VLAVDAIFKTPGKKDPAVGGIQRTVAQSALRLYRSSMSRIRFRIVPPIDRANGPVWISGNHPALGGWNPAEALPLEFDGVFHCGEIEAETGTRLEYKITRGSWEMEEVDAYGNVPPNHHHDVWLDATLHHTLPDWKDRYRGRLTHERIHSRILAGERDLLIWLPPGYAQENQTRFPVVFLNDGANVLDPRSSVISGVDWAADEWVGLLARQGVLPESIVVGICHPEGYAEDNLTMRDFELSPEFGGAAHAQFVSTELVAHMDQHYRTIANRQARTLGGAGLGALNVFHTAISHPGVFSRFVCLSTSFEDVSQSLPLQSASLQALEAEPALDAGIRMYFDHGDQGLDECYGVYYTLLAENFRAKGWAEGREFTIREIPGGSHSEISWRARFDPALRFVNESPVGATSSQPPKNSARV
jgi:enterochelin esterase-like enzyme